MKGRQRGVWPAFLLRWLCSLSVVVLSGILMSCLPGLPVSKTWGAESVPVYSEKEHSGGKTETGTDMFEAVEAALSGQQLEDLQEIDRFFRDQDLGTGASLSFTELVKCLMRGDGKAAGRMILDAARQGLFREMEEGGRIAGQLLMLGLVGAVFANFSEIFSGGQMADTGFFMTYLMAFTLLAAAFLESVQIAGDVLSQQVLFMKVLMPAYGAAVAWAGAAVTGAAWCEMVLLLISAVQWLYLNLILPGIRVYLLLVMVGHMVKEDMLSKMTELLKSGIQWGLRSLLGLVVGFQLIQGMVLPYADSVKTTGVQKLLAVIPGVGAGAGAVTKLVLGSGVLIKNTVGAASVVVLLLLSLLPMLKLAVLLLLYRSVAAVLEPVADKRLVSCINGVADGQKLLLDLVVSGLLLFVITIALICLGTNAVYLA